MWSRRTHVLEVEDSTTDEDAIELDQCLSHCGLIEQDTDAVFDTLPGVDCFSCNRYDPGSNRFSEIEDVGFPSQDRDLAER